MTSASISPSESAPASRKYHFPSGSESILECYYGVPEEERPDFTTNRLCDEALFCSMEQLEEMFEREQQDDADVKYTLMAHLQGTYEDLIDKAVGFCTRIAGLRAQKDSAVGGDDVHFFRIYKGSDLQGILCMLMKRNSSGSTTYCLRKYAHVPGCPECIPEVAIGIGRQESDARLLDIARTVMHELGHALAMEDIRKILENPTDEVFQSTVDRYVALCEKGRMATAADFGR